MKKRISLNELIRREGYRKDYLATQLGISPEHFSRLLKKPEKIMNDKLKFERLCEILKIDSNDIDWTI